MADLLRVGVLVSGTGTNLQSLLDACRSGEVPAEIAVVISNVPEAFALVRARRAGVPAVVLDHRTFPSKRTGWVSCVWPASSGSCLRRLSTRSGAAS
jgi:phosphoribosylglycinamide formyltransferase-1